MGTNLSDIFSWTPWWANPTAILYNIPTGEGGGTEPVPGIILDTTNWPIMAYNGSSLGDIDLEISNSGSRGQEIIWALIDKIASAAGPLASGGITVNVSTSLVSGNQIRKTYTFSLITTPVPMNLLDVK